MQEGQIKVWRVATGKCLRRFNRAHSEGIVGLCFNRDGSQVASCSHDHTARVHGLRSGKTLREFRGHTALVNSVTCVLTQAAGRGRGGRSLTCRACVCLRRDFFSDAITRASRRDRRVVA